jgi:hypothetical protein
MPACSSRTACSPPSTRPPADSRCPGGEPVLLSDTVGFVRRLPHGLVEAFKGTLEVAARADHLVHVVDAELARSRRADRGGARGARRDRRASVPELLVFNKVDLARRGEAARRAASRIGRGQRRQRRGCRAVPAHAGDRLRSAPRWSSCTSRSAAATCWRRCTARVRCSARCRAPGAGWSCGPVSAIRRSGRLAEFVAAADVRRAVMMGGRCQRPRQPAPVASSHRRTRTTGSTGSCRSPSATRAVSSTSRSAPRWIRRRRRSSPRSVRPVPSAAIPRASAAGAARGVRPLDRAPLRRRRRPGAHRRVHRHQGVRRHDAAPAAVA